MADPEVEATFDEFWRDLVMTATCPRCNGSGAIDGGYPDYDALDCPAGCDAGYVLDLDQVKAELHDYRMLLREVPVVYSNITAGRISKPNTKAEAVLEVANEVIEDRVRDELSDARLRHLRAQPPRGDL